MISTNNRIVYTLYKGRYIGQYSWIPGVVLLHSIHLTMKIFLNNSLSTSKSCLKELLK